MIIRVKVKLREQDTLREPRAEHRSRCRSDVTMAGARLAIARRTSHFFLQDIAYQHVSSH